MAFKMKGSSLYGKINLNRGGQKAGAPKKTDPTTKETVTVTDKKGHERGQNKLSRVKTQTKSMAEGDQAGNLSKEYGGNWKQANNPNAPGSGKQWLNDKGETVRESAMRQGQEYNKKKREYQAANTTKKAGAPKKTDPPVKPDMDKQQNIANPDGGTWASGKPKTYKTLQSDGTYKVVTNPSGDFSKTAEDLVDTHVTKKQDAENREQSVQDLVTKTNKKSRKKQKRKESRKKLASKVKGIFTGSGKRKRQQDYENLLDQE